mmetsp:Transcript_18138/g.50443  ORF Transcript_18138/g.50443 Transcript_18138/m.50443 type:complete len:256 (+) Transcript_18138:1217-1984(+)
MVGLRTPSLCRCCCYRSLHEKAFSVSCHCCVCSFRCLWTTASPLSHGCTLPRCFRFWLFPKTLTFFRLRPRGRRCCCHSFRSWFGLTCPLRFRCHRSSSRTNPSRWFPSVSVPHPRRSSRGLCSVWTWYHHRSACHRWSRCRCWRLASMSKTKSKSLAFRGPHPSTGGTRPRRPPFPSPHGPSRTRQTLRSCAPPCRGDVEIPCQCRRGEHRQFHRRRRRHRHHGRTPWHTTPSRREFPPGPRNERSPPASRSAP